MLQEPDLVQNNQPVNDAQIIDHTAFAFIAAKTGNLDFLEVLLGPTIPAERARQVELWADIETHFSKRNTLEFTKKMAELRLANFQEALDVLQSSQDSTTVLRVLNGKLHEGIAALVDKCVLAELDRINVHASAHFNARDFQFPIIDMDDAKVPPPSLTFHDFFAQWKDIKSDENDCYHVQLNSEMKIAIGELWRKRFNRQVEKKHFEIHRPDAIPSCITIFKQEIDNIEALIDEANRPLKPLADEAANLCDHLYNNRKQRFRQLIEKFTANPDAMPTAYHRHSHNLYDFMKVVEVPVNVIDAMGNTLLHVATEANKFMVVKLLLDRNANIKTVNNALMTPADLLGDNEDALKQLAKVYSKRSESKFLADVEAHFRAYKTSHTKFMASIARYLHNKKRLTERSEQLIQIEMLIDAAKDSPSDDTLAKELIKKYNNATRGPLGRSRLFDPLEEHVIKFFNKIGYGVSSDDVRELLHSTASAKSELNSTIDKLKTEIDDKKALIAQLEEKLSETIQLYTETRDLNNLQNEKIIKSEATNAKIIIENEALKEQGKKSKRAIDDMEQKIKEQQSDIDNRNTKIGELEAENKKRETENRALEAKMALVEDNLTKIMQELQQEKMRKQSKQKSDSESQAQQKPIPSIEVATQPIPVGVNPNALFGVAGSQNSMQFGMSPISLENLSSSSSPNPGPT